MGFYLNNENKIILLCECSFWLQRLFKMITILFDITVLQNQHPIPNPFLLSLPRDRPPCSHHICDRVQGRSNIMTTLSAIVSNRLRKRSSLSRSASFVFLCSVLSVAIAMKEITFLLRLIGAKRVLRCAGHYIYSLFKDSQYRGKTD